MAGLLLFLRPILILFGGTGVILNYAEEFMRIIIFSVTFQIIGYDLNYCIRAEGNPIMSLLTIILGAIVNLVLNPLFIVGMHLGVPSLVSVYINFTSRYCNLDIFILCKF